MGLLRELGWEDVRYYPGGLERWRGEGLLLAAGEAPGGGAEPRRPAALPPVPSARSFAGRLVDAVEEMSTARLFGLWLLLIVVSGVAFFTLGRLPGHGLVAGGHAVRLDLAGLVTAIYFSFVTATSVGFGDVVPVGASRVLAVLEAAAELLVFGAVIAKFVSRRQDRVVAEIHRLAYEDRLSRVQANLHLSLSEFQAVSALCRAPGTPPLGVRARVVSAALVFSGELRTVHGLLYRPEGQPEEPVLESILAGLSASLRELAELLLCAEGKVERPASLESALGRVAALAREICGECVPRQYAPDLRALMDEIQAQARRIDPSPG